MSGGASSLVIAVVVPAHDEADLLVPCLTALSTAATRAHRYRIDVESWIVLDACSDDSESMARAAGANTVIIDARNVGAARQRGVDAALATFADVDPSRLWLAHTDADSTVPANWLVHQAHLACRGADVVVGTVRPDFRDLSPEQRHAWELTHTRGVANGHVHGANLGIRASTFLAAGGFPAAAVGEDVSLVDSARANGARIVASDAAWVQTSGRRFGRAPDGYARYLREDLIPAAHRSSTAGSSLISRRR